MAKVQAGELVSVKMEVRVPVDATVEQIEAWLRFEFNSTGSCAAGNPLMAFAPEPWANSFDWALTGERGMEVEGPREKIPGGGERFTVFYRRERVTHARD